MPRERKGSCRTCGSSDFYPAGGCKVCCANKPCRVCGAVERAEDGKCQPCKRARAKSYREADPEKHRDRCRDGYAKNREVRKGESRERRKNRSPDEIAADREYQKRYREEHKEDSRAYGRQYRERNADSIREKKKEYGAANTSEIKQYQQERRAYLASQGLCIHCGEKVASGFKACEKCIVGMRDAKYRSRYGLDRYEAIAMLETQNGCCAICEKSIRVGDGIEKVPRCEVACVDHVHTTAAVRGILCNECNASVGQDERPRLAEMVPYLAKTRPVELFPRSDSKRSGIRLQWLERQGGRCGVCQTVLPDDHEYKVALDHDHKTGLIRGVLCTRCNHILGNLRDDPKIIQAAIDYLTKHEDALAPKKASNG